MTRLLFILFSVLVVCACAAVDDPIATTVSATPTPIPTATPIDSQHTQTADESQTAIPSTSTAAPTEFHSVEAPKVEQSEVPIVLSNKNERVCTREKRTGSNRAMRVCRTRAEMERLEEESKDTFRALHRSQTGEK